MLNNAVVQGFYADYAQAVEQTVSVRDHFVPDMEKHKRYMELYPLYKEIREALQPTWETRQKLFYK